MLYSVYNLVELGNNVGLTRVNKSLLFSRNNLGPDSA